MIELTPLIHGPIEELQSAYLQMLRNGESEKADILFDEVSYPIGGFEHRYCGTKRGLALLHTREQHGFKLDKSLRRERQIQEKEMDWMQEISYVLYSDEETQTQFYLDLLRKDEPEKSEKFYYASSRINGYEDYPRRLTFLRAAIKEGLASEEAGHRRLLAGLRKLEADEYKELRAQIPKKRKTLLSRLGI